MVALLPFLANIRPAHSQWSPRECSIIIICSQLKMKWTRKKLSLKCAHTAIMFLSNFNPFLLLLLLLSFQLGGKKIIYAEVGNCAERQQPPSNKKYTHRIGDSNNAKKIKKKTIIYSRILSSACILSSLFYGNKNANFLHSCRKTEVSLSAQRSVWCQHWSSWHQQPMRLSARPPSTTQPRPVFQNNRQRRRVDTLSSTSSSLWSE